MRFHDTALVVESSNEFKLQVVGMSTLQGLSIRFADSVLEKDRQRHVSAKQLSEDEVKRNIEEKNKQQQEQGRASGRDYRGL